jgi:hypothetical protein
MRPGKTLSGDSAHPRPIRRPGRQLGPAAGSSLTAAASPGNGITWALGAKQTLGRMLPANPRARRRLRRARDRIWLVISVDAFSRPGALHAGAGGLRRTCSAKNARTRCQESAAAAGW